MFGEVYSPSPSCSTPTCASELLTFTTDVRMEKVGQLFQTSPGLNEKEVDMEGSGGGGPCEAVFWVEEMKTQWRVRGDAWVLCAEDIEEAEGARMVRNLLGGRMRTATPVDGKDGNTTIEKCEGEWSWKKEIEAHWEILPQGVKRSFGNTSPGLFRKSGDQEHRTEDARENFRVCVIRPFEVEQLDLRVSGEGRCWRYIYKEDVSAKKENDLAAGGWKTEDDRKSVSKANRFWH
jgi:pyridoxamine 5'-phosphate oxidase